MYAPDTILVLKEPRTVGTPASPDYDPKNPKAGGTPPSKDYAPFAYDRVRVIGESPIQHSGGARSEWVGAGARGVMIEPLTHFGANLDEPLGRLQSLYDIESEPIIEVPVMQTVRVIQPGQAGPTPEEVFAEHAKANPSPPQENKWKSPLADAARVEAEKRRAADAKVKL